MHTTPQNEEDLWNALLEAYEKHAPDEARLLLQQNAPMVNCRLLAHCNDADYLLWLLSHDLIRKESLTLSDNEWPGLQERQLQCDTLPEPQRPVCILRGEWEHRDKGEHQ